VTANGHKTQLEEAEEINAIWNKIRKRINGSCIIHILYTECAKIKTIIPAPKG